jgi:NitT/TauT family transport system ATP-binding protein
MSSVTSPGTDPDQSFLRLHGLSKVYATRDGPVRALDQVSVTERRGEFLSILGPSGLPSVFGVSQTCQDISDSRIAIAGSMACEYLRAMAIISSGFLRP